MLASTIVVAVLALPVLIPGPASADAISDKRAQAEQITAKLDQLNQRLSMLDEQYNNAQLGLVKAEADISDAQSRVDATNADLERRSGELRSFAVQAYMTGNDTPAFEAVLTSSADEATQKKSYLEAASGSRQDLLDELSSTKQKLAQEVVKLDEAKGQAQGQRDLAAKARDQADAAINEQQQIQSQTQGELATLVQQEQQRQAEAQLAKAKADAAAAQAATQAAAQAAASRPAPPRTSTVPPSTGGSGPAPAPAPAPGGGGAVNGGAAAAIAAARSVLGAPYVWAAAGPNAFDCSGLVMWAWAHGGRSLPHSSAAMYSSTRRIAMSDIQPGDLVFYGTPIHHVALYIGGGQIIHAPHSGSYVQIDSVGYWKDLKGAGRV